MDIASVLIVNPTWDVELDNAEGQRPIVQGWDFEWEVNDAMVDFLCQLRHECESHQHLSHFAQIYMYSLPFWLRMHKHYWCFFSSLASCDLSLASCVLIQKFWKLPEFSATDICYRHVPGHVDLSWIFPSCKFSRDTKLLTLWTVRIIWMFAMQLRQCIISLVFSCLAYSLALS